MSILWSFRILFVCMFTFSLASIQPNSMVQLNDENFYNHTTYLDKPMLIEFITPWCRYCQHFKEVYEDIALELSKDEHVITAIIDASKELILPSHFDVNEVPTIFFIRNKSTWKYKGEMSKEAILSFISDENENRKQPISWIINPVGALGRIRWMTIELGILISYSYKIVKDRTGMNDMAFKFLLILFGFGLFMITTLFAIVWLISILFKTKVKDD